MGSDTRLRTNQSIFSFEVQDLGPKMYPRWSGYIYTANGYVELNSIHNTRNEAVLAMYTEAVQILTWEAERLGNNAARIIAKKTKDRKRKR